MHVDHRQRLATSNGERQRLGTVVVEHHLADLVGHLGEQLVPLRDPEPALGHRRAEQDLDVHLVVAAVNARRVIDRVGVDQAARQRIFNATALGEAQVATLAHHLAAQLSAVDAQAVVGAVADFGMRFARRLDVRADAAVPEQIDRRTQDCSQQLVRCE